MTMPPGLVARAKAKLCPPKEEQQLIAALKNYGIPDPHPIALMTLGFMKSAELFELGAGMRPWGPALVQYILNLVTPAPCTLFGFLLPLSGEQKAEVVETLAGAGFAPGVLDDLSYQIISCNTNPAVYEKWVLLTPWGTNLHRYTQHVAAKLILGKTQEKQR